MGVSWVDVGTRIGSDLQQCWTGGSPVYTDAFD